MSGTTVNSSSYHKVSLDGTAVSYTLAAAGQPLVRCSGIQET